MKNPQLLNIILLCNIALFSCRGSKEIVVADKITAQTLVVNSTVFSDIFTGFLLINPETDEVLANQYEDKQMTPASNTKIFTMYTCTQILGDSIPSLRYLIQGDSLLFWGTGDPTFGHPDFKNNRAVELLKNWKGQLFYVPQFNKNRFGAGWSWDDYNGSYSTELTTFPIYGNMITYRKAANKKETITPKYFEQFKQSTKASRVTRSEFDNTIYVPNFALKNSYHKDLPIKVSNEVILELLKELTEKEVKFYWKLDNEMRENHKVIYSYKTNDVLKAMMQPSDNFMAEQLLLVCASVKKIPLETRGIINFALDSLLQNTPDKLVWRDASGVSRYNMFTPRSIVYVLNEMYQHIDTTTLFDIFPTGGKTGTLKKWYPGNPPYVHAKTGTLSNNHCLSGYVKTNSGKVLIFSFMNNHYVGSSSPYKREMQRTLEWIRDNL